MPPHLFRAAARCWERAGHFDRAAERYARAAAWADAGRCWSQAGRPVDAADAYARAGEPVGEARQWLASPWPERARRPYRQALEMGLSMAAEVEALLGLGEIEMAAERSFAVASENRRSVEALRSLARIAAARGRPDLAARAWNEVIAGSPAAAREVLEDWERAAPWNRSIGRERPQMGSPGWPSRAFRDVRLELLWEERLSITTFGNHALAWSADGRRFAVATWSELILGDLTGPKVQHQSVKMDAQSVAFIPESDSVLVGSQSGHVIRVDASGIGEDIGALRMSKAFGVVTFSPQGKRVALSTGDRAGAILRVWSWAHRRPEHELQERQTQEQTRGFQYPACAWSPDGQTLAWCPGPWGKEGIPNNLYLVADAATICISAAHDDGICGIAFSPDERQLITVSEDRTIALRDAQTGEVVASPWVCTQRPLTAVFHPCAALLAVGGMEDYELYDRPSQLYLFRFVQTDPPHLETLTRIVTKKSVRSLAFSLDGENLLMSTYDRLSLFRVHLI